MTSEDLLREAQDPSTTAARLQELAQLDRATWIAIAAHPLAYDGLLDWLGQHGDDSVRAAILARSGTLPLIATDAEPTTEIPTDVEPTAVFPATERAATAAPSYGSVGAAPVPEAAAPNSTTRSPFVLAAIAGAVLVVLIGGYFGVSALTGGDDDDPASAISSQTNPTEDPAGEATGEPTGDSSEADDDFCTIMKEIQQSSLDSFDPTDSEAPDLDALKDTFDDMADAYGELEDSAPDNLKADVARMGTYLDVIANPTAENAQELATGIEDYIASTQRVTEYYATTCNP